MAERMPPPGTKKPGVAIVIGVGKPKDGGKMPPPGSKPPEAAAPEGAGGAKSSREEALYVPDDHHCKDCEHWQPQTGECSEVEGTFNPEDACLRWFEAGGSGDDEPDADEAGGAPDMDEDDQTGQAG